MRALLLLLASVAAAAGGAPPLLPGGVLNLTTFTLQTPLPAPREVAYPALAAYNSSVFYAAPCAGAPSTPCVTFWAPETGATTPNSPYPRSELRQNVQWRAPAQGAPRQAHVQLATLAVLSGGARDSVTVGQIHTDGAAACSIIVELEWTAGQVVAHLRDASCRGSSVVVGRAALGQAFSYNLSMVGDAVQVVTDSGSMPPYQYSVRGRRRGPAACSLRQAPRAPRSLTHRPAPPRAPQWFAGKAEPQMYFKAGAYLQSSGTDSSIGGRVQFSALATSHYTV
jgi:hypothetical protein